MWLGAKLDVATNCNIRNLKRAIEFIGNNNKLSFVQNPGHLPNSNKELGYGLDPGSIPGVGGVEIFPHSFVSRLVLGST